MADIEPNDIVQITNERTGLIGAFVLVSEVRPWGIQGFIHNIVTFEESNQIWLRLTPDQYEKVGRAVLAPQKEPT